MCTGSAQVNPCADGAKGTLWDEGDCITDRVDFNTTVSRPLISELTIDFSGSTQLAYYFAARCYSLRNQNWRLYIDSTLKKEGVIQVTGDGKYLVFQLDDVAAGAVIRFETENQLAPNCPSNPNNTVLSGVFLSNCEPKCSIGDYVWEDADRDGCQGPDERGINGVTVELYDRLHVHKTKLLIRRPRRIPIPT